MMGDRRLHRAVTSLGVSSVQNSNNFGETFFGPSDILSRFVTRPKKEKRREERNKNKRKNKTKNKNKNKKKKEKKGPNTYDGVLGVEKVASWDTELVPGCLSRAEAWIVK